MMAGGGTVTHDLYVHLASDPSGGSEQGQQARQRTLEILYYIDSRLAIFREMRLRVRVHKVRGGDLHQPRLRTAMERRGISSLPALVTPNNTYLGVSAIGGVYEKNCRDFAAWKQKSRGIGAGRAPPPLRPEEDLASFYRREMGGGDDDGPEDGDDAMGEGGDIMDSYRAMMAQRETGRAPPRKGGGRGVRPEAVPSRGAPRGPGALGRAHNVGRAEEEGREEFSNLVTRMGGPIDSRTRSVAFAGGGDGPDDDGGDDGAMGGNAAQDDLMEQAYWGNMEESLP